MLWMWSHADAQEASTYARQAAVPEMRSVVGGHGADGRPVVLVLIPALMPKLNPQKQIVHALNQIAAIRRMARDAEKGIRAALMALAAARKAQRAGEPLPRAYGPPQGRP